MADETTPTSKLWQYMRHMGIAGALIALAGCSTPREALAPAPASSSAGTVYPTSDLHRVRNLTPATYAARPSRLDELPADIQQAWQKTGLPDSALSLVVAEINQPPLIAVNPTEPRNPASVMKLITTFAALEGLGPSYTWRTELLASPGADVNANGMLGSPLYIRAGGDPTLGLEDAWSLLRELRLRGIRVLPGIVIDRSVYGHVAIDPGAFDSSPDRVYNASPDAFVIGSGAIRLKHVPDEVGRRWQVVLDPPVRGIRIHNQVRASTAACNGRPSVKTEPSRSSDTLTLRVSGTVPLSCGEFSLYRLALAQPEHAAQVLQALWENLGGQLTGPVLDGLVPPDAVVLASHESAPLSDVVRTVNKRSDNLVARMMLLALAREYSGQPATSAAGQAAVQQVLAHQGLRFPELVIENGSGLSRVGRVSAASLASMLNTAWSSARMPEFVSSLAIAGEDGTMRWRLRNNDARGAAHLKTGTLRDSSALAGYVSSASGKRYLVVALVNHPKAYASRGFADSVVAWVSQR